MGTRPRDSQVSRVNTAEAKIRQGLAQQQAASLQSRAARTVNTPWFQDEATKAGRTVAGVFLNHVAFHKCDPPMRGRAVDLRFASGRFTMVDMVHSLAHVITPDHVALHGPEFARNMIEVARVADGMRFRNQLRDQFNADKVKWRIWSPEAKAKAKARAEENGTPFSRNKVSRETQQEDIINLARELAGLPPLEEPEDPIERMLKAAKRQIT